MNFLSGLLGGGGGGGGKTTSSTSGVNQASPSQIGISGTELAIIAGIFAGALVLAVLVYTITKK